MEYNFVGKCTFWESIGYWSQENISGISSSIKVFGFERCGVYGKSLMHTLSQIIVKAVVTFCENNHACVIWLLKLVKAITKNDEL